MSMQSRDTPPAASEILGDRGISDQRAAALQELWQSLQMLCIATRSHANRMAAEYGLSNPQFTVLNVLSAREPMTMGQIGEHSDLPTSSLTALVDRLVDLELASRTAHPSDRRAIQVQLTDGGYDLSRRVAVDALQATTRITDGLEDGQLDQASDAIASLLAGYGQYIERLGRTPPRPPARRPRSGRLDHPDGAAHPNHDGGQRDRFGRAARSHHDSPVSPSTPDEPE